MDVDRGRYRRALSTYVWLTITASSTSGTGTAASSVAFRNVSLSEWSAKVSHYSHSVFTCMLISTAPV